MYLIASASFPADCSAGLATRLLIGGRVRSPNAASPLGAGSTFDRPALASMLGLALASSFTSRSGSDTAFGKALSVFALGFALGLELGFAVRAARFRRATP
jgi:hypothetical protein